MLLLAYAWAVPDGVGVVPLLTAGAVVDGAAGVTTDVDVVTVLPTAGAVDTGVVVAVGTVTAGGAAVAGVVVAVDEAAVDVVVEVVIGVTLTPVTFPVMVAFCFLLVVPRAARVAFAFADAARRAAADRGCRGFFGWMSKAARVVVSLTYRAATSLRMCATSGAYWETVVASACLASVSAVFAFAVADTALRTVEMTFTAWTAV